MNESIQQQATTAKTAREGAISSQDSPNGKRRGWLKHGNAPGDFHNCARCGAKTRKGTACKSPAMRNGRCRMHGGASTGPRTREGRKKCAETHSVHGFYSKEILEQRRALRLASRANVIGLELSTNKIVRTLEQLGEGIPALGEEALEPGAKLFPSTVRRKTAQSRRILEKLIEIPSFRRLRTVRQRRRLRKHLRQGETGIAHSQQAGEQTDADKRVQLEEMAKQQTERAQAASAIAAMAAEEAMKTIADEKAEQESR